MQLYIQNPCVWNLLEDIMFELDSIEYLPFSDPKTVVPWSGDTKYILAPVSAPSTKVVPCGRVLLLLYFCKIKFYLNQ